MGDNEDGIRLNGRYYLSAAFGRSEAMGQDSDYRHLLQAEGIPDSVVDFLRQWWSPCTYIIVHTSGSTGSPRPIRLSRARMRASAQLTDRFFNFREGMPALLSLDVSHIAGKMMLVRALVSRLDLWVTPPTSRPDLVYPQQNFEFCPLVPTQLWRMLEADGDLGRLGTFLLGAAPVAADRLPFLHSLKQEVYQGFGMTETCSHIALRRLQPQGDGIYRSLPGVQWRVDHGGCLLLRAAATGHRWLRTQDRVQPEGDGFRWLGRADWVINVGGIKVHPEVVEGRLNALRLKLHKLNDLLNGEFVVLGWSDPYKGSVPICVVEDYTSNPIQKFLSNGINEQIDLPFSPSNPPKDVQSCHELPPPSVTNPINEQQAPFPGVVDPRYSPDWLKPYLKPEEIPRILLRIHRFPRSPLGKILRHALAQKGI